MHRSWPLVSEDLMRRAWPLVFDKLSGLRWFHSSVLIGSQAQGFQRNCFLVFLDWSILAKQDPALYGDEKKFNVRSSEPCASEVESCHGTFWGE